MHNHKPPLPPPLSISQPKPFSNSDESTRSPLRSNSPHLSDDLHQDHDPDYSNNGAIVFFSPLSSPFPETSPREFSTSDHNPSPPRQSVHSNVRDGAPTQCGVVHGGGGGGERNGKRSGVRFGVVEDIGRKKDGEKRIEKVNLGIRVLEIVFCLISFSVMAADKTQGWSGDSFDRYKEFRFCLSVNVLGFLYAAFQAYDAVTHLATGRHVINHQLHYQFDFVMDQILAYLLISASSASASRVDDWQSNWGKDEFTEKASASVSMAFLAFLGFAMTSLISGYNLCNRDLS